MSEFIIYARDGCKFCDKLATVMTARSIPYTKLMLGEDYTREEFIDQFGDKGTFPRVLHEGELIGGMTETVKYLQENNYV